ncbi:DNA polymerase alpha subunit B [Camellia lanceoleosa]|uniref:DNA polymerase alpha subunit B n=1 Tax=Camellia lanceoleosa TaxID=1840588 RepID=A0ACC0G885_9ERIC|nr:DNA polymerase alpha subunit B [Camellia lanceoleosa]
MEEEIKAEFKKNGFNLDEEEEILKKCLTFCIQYKLSPADLVSSWDVYSLNRQLELTVQNAHMDAFLLQLQNEQKEAIIKKESGLHLYSNDTFSSIKPLESVTPFGQRKSKFVVQSTLNELPNVENVKKEHDHEISEDDIIKRVQPSSRCSLVSHGSQPEPGCRFMYDKIEDKFNFLENRIRKHATALVASGLFEEPIDPTVASQKSVFAVGMICCEEEGRLKEKPVLLQSSVEHSGGQRVRLDLQKLSQFSIFPGQVVGVEGHNPSGHCLTASKIIDYTPLSGSADENPHPTKKQVVDQEFQLTDPSHVLAVLSMIIAAGPFTTTDNLFFEPLTELLAYARRKQPQLLLLLGPFIDSEHPEIKKGAVNRTFDEIFRLEILGRLQDYVEYMGSAARVILVPSIRDANHDFVFPQSAFDIQQADLKHQITSLTNPGIFSANEVKLGCCTVDILKQLSGEEISRNPSGGSKQRMNRLANHLLSQRSFYPLYPPMEDTPVDFLLLQRLFRSLCCQLGIKMTEKSKRSAFVLIREDWLGAKKQVSSWSLTTGEALIQLVLQL